MASKRNESAAPKSRFAIVVPAHNEAMVLGDLLDNLRILKYPKELYDVFVIADNCTDNTADIARAHGAHVFERENKELVGKGYAMDWVFPKIFALDKKYDAFCVFDSDNLVHLDFLAVMNNRLLKGQKVLQGYLSAKNPTDTWVSGTLPSPSGPSTTSGISASTIWASPPVLAAPACASLPISSRNTAGAVTA